MKLNINIDGRLQSCHSELPLTHVLIGQRSPAFEAPSQDLIDRAREGKKITSEESVELRAWIYTIEVDKKYSVHALAWVESEEQAEAIKSRFPEPQWQQDSLQVVPVERS